MKASARIASDALGFPRAWQLALLCSLAVGCGPAIPLPDGGPIDAGPLDARDAGLGDAGRLGDAGGDAGPEDAGGLGDAGGDAGFLEGGPRDAGPQRSIRDWVACDGKTDDTFAAATAFAAAANGAFTLVVDCPVFLHVGMDIARPIFIDNGTTVSFTGNGLFVVDNVEVPTFVLANSNDVAFDDWRVQYVGHLPISADAGGYFEDGGFVVSPGQTQPAGAFNDQRLTPWLTQHRGIVFDHSQGWITARWWGGADPSAIFFFDGSSSRITIRGLRLFVSTATGAEGFIPMCFAFEVDFRSNQTVTAQTPYTATYFAASSDLTFTDIDIDGALMGWQGNVQNATFTTVRSHRYADLQDADGGNVGGLSKWWPPPHLFYLNYDYTGDPALFNENIQITDVIDYGVRVGVARDTNASNRSGFANSLKIGGVNSTVDGYQSYRPDGMLDVLTSNGLTLKNLSGTYDSSFLNNLWPGVRWPGYPYTKVALANVSLADQAASSTEPPMVGQNGTALLDTGITASGVTFTLNAWAGSGNLVANFGEGAGNDVALDYQLLGDPAAIESQQVNGMACQIEAHPSTVVAGGATTLTWSSANATACTASGAWNGSQSPAGSAASPALAKAGDAGFVLTCSGSQGSCVAAVSVAVIP